MGTLAPEPPRGLELGPAPPLRFPPFQAGFQRAMDLVREEFLQRLDFYQHSWLPARALVEEALAQRLQVHAWGETL